MESPSSSTLQPALERAGFRVVAIRDGSNAIAFAATSCDIDALVLGGDVEGVHGLDLVSYLRHRFPSAPLIYLGRRDADIVERAALRRGAKICLHKPMGVKMRSKPTIAPPLPVSLRSVQRMPRTRGGVAGTGRVERAVLVIIAVASAYSDVRAPESWTKSGTFVACCLSAKASFARTDRSCAHGGMAARA